mmetsp:Transcript_48929/g.140603  ORF Transcript_48929/g.140603 Transcript_48929/m.140603 type:complete len:219 (-) Transcript_48929:18-674(-)
MVLEPTEQQVVNLVQRKHDEVVDHQTPFGDHVLHAHRRPDNDMLAVAQAVDVPPCNAPRDARVATDMHVVAHSLRQLLDGARELARGHEDQRLASGRARVDALEHPDDQRRGLPSTRRRVTNDVAAVEDGLDAALLEGALDLEAASVEAPTQLRVEVVVVEGLDRPELLARALGEHGAHTEALLCLLAPPRSPFFNPRAPTRERKSAQPMGAARAKMA